MLALYRAGRQAEALSVYQCARNFLVEEIGSEPGTGLREMHQRILAADPALIATGSARLAESDAPIRQAGSGAPVSAAAEVRYSLPPDTVAFTGRSEELDQITAAVAGAAGPGGVVMVGAIDGMPGVGKTALAVHVAHVLSGRFPDRQLFIDLHAHTPGREPLAAEDALAGLLAATGVDPRFVPEDLDGRAALWRDRMAGQRALLVLDNAGSSAQVGPLLPGGGECVVLVTSRRHLGDLPGAVVPVLLDVLSAARAEEMFTRLAPRAAANPAGVADVARLAGFLPLAVSLLARVFARHQSWTLPDLATETRAGLLTLTAEQHSVAAAFEVSYRHLDPARRQFFDLLGLHPGATIDRYAAAAHRVTGGLVEAEACHQQALKLARAIGSAPHEAHALAGLGRCAATAGHAMRAEALLRHALEIFQRIGAADVPSVLAELDALTCQDQHDRNQRPRVH
jgi:hypothetical protein